MILIFFINAFDLINIYRKRFTQSKTYFLTDTSYLKIKINTKKLPLHNLSIVKATDSFLMTIIPNSPSS